MNFRKLAAPFILGTLLLAMLVSVVLTKDSLPARLATHFDESGIPNGWMQGDGFLIFTLGMAIGTVVFMLVIFWSIRFAPNSSINLPNREYWLSAEQRPKTVSDLFHWGVELAVGVTALQAYLYFAVIAANRLTPPHLSTGIWIVTALFGAFVAFQIFRLLRRFKQLPTS